MSSFGIKRLLLEGDVGAKIIILRDTKALIFRNNPLSLRPIFLTTHN